jgi:hypothetical protein
MEDILLGVYRRPPNQPPDPSTRIGAKPADTAPECNESLQKPSVLYLVL